MELERSAMQQAFAAAFLSAWVGAAMAQETNPDAQAQASTPEAAPADASQQAETTPPEPAAASESSPPETVDTVAVDPAATDDQPAAASAPHNRVIEEVVVTAQKREEKIQDVPISIQAFSGEALNARGVTDTSALAQTVPSLQFINAAGFQLIFMRGIGTDNPIPSADRSIATYIDGIFLPVGQSVVQGISAVERVEVLKGPQGTLFGRNATGGAINIITAEPGHEFSGEVTGEAGNFNRHSAKAMMNVPVTDWLAFSIAGQYSKVDSYYDNINYEMPPEINRAARLKVRIEPLDDMSISLTAFHSDYHGATAETAENTDPSPLLGSLVLQIPNQPDDFTAESDFKVDGHSSQNFYYGTVTYEMPWFDVKLLGSDIQVRTPYTAFDFDGSRRPYVGFDGSHEFTKQYTGELQIVSNADSWNAEHFKWTIGAYWLKSQVGLHPAHIHVASEVLTALAGIDTSGLNALLTGLGLENTPLGPQGLNLSFFGTLGTKSYSAYAQATYYFTDWVDLTLGGRGQKEKRYLIESHTDLTDLDNGFDGGSTPLLQFPLNSTTAKNFSPKAVLSFHPADDALIYFSYAAGFKSGTYNIVNIYLPPNYIKPEKITTYEIGSKIDFLEGRLRLNSALFWNDIDNLQTRYISLLAGGTLRFQSAGKARTRGAEFDLTYLPFPEWDAGLVFTANGAYIDSEYLNFTDASGYDDQGLFHSGGQDFSGHRMVYAPKWSGAVGAIQTVDVNSGTIEVALDGYYNGGYYADVENHIKEKAYALMNGRLSYLHSAWGTRITLFGRNLLDKRYHMQRFQNDFGVLNALAPPREYGVTLSWDF